MKEKIGFGIVGCGTISKWHAVAVTSNEEAKLVGVTDRNSESAGRFVKNYPCRIFSSYEEMLDCDEIDAVCLCTPSGLHAPLAVQAAKAKKHIVVEKPMAITKQQLNDMITACEENHVKVCVISQLRFTPSMQTVKKAIEDGVLGKIILADVYMKYYRSPEYYASGSWRGTWELDGGGALMNQGIHGIDVLQYLVGPVKSVFGITKTLARNIEVEDTANVLVEYENGAIGTIQGTTSVNPGYPRVIEISGTNGTVVLKEDVIIRWDVEGSDFPVEKAIGMGEQKSFNDPAGFTTEYHRLQIADMVHAIKESRRPLIDMYEGRRPVDIILAAYESNRTGKKIELS